LAAAAANLPGSQANRNGSKQSISKLLFTKVAAMIRSRFDAGPFRGDLGRDDSLGINPRLMKVGSQLRLLVEAVASCQA
jgi:hypothetical protein